MNYTNKIKPLINASNNINQPNSNPAEIQQEAYNFGSKGETKTQFAMIAGLQGCIDIPHTSYLLLGMPLDSYQPSWHIQVALINFLALVIPSSTGVSSTLHVVCSMLAY